MARTTNTAGRRPTTTLMLDAKVSTVLAYNFSRVSFLVSGPPFYGTALPSMIPMHRPRAQLRSRRHAPRSPIKEAAAVAAWVGLRAALASMATALSGATCCPTAFVVLHPSLIGSQDGRTTLGHVAINMAKRKKRGKEGQDSLPVADLPRTAARPKLVVFDLGKENCLEARRPLPDFLWRSA